MSKYLYKNSKAIGLVWGKKKESLLGDALILGISVVVIGTTAFYAWKMSQTPGLRSLQPCHTCGER